MNATKYRRILYFISFVILLTLCVQGYWSYKNYLSEKQQLITDVQVSLDNAIDTYFTNLAKERTFEYFSDSIPKDSIFLNIRSLNLFKHLDAINNVEAIKLNDSSKFREISVIGNLENIKSECNDSLKQQLTGLDYKTRNPFEALTSKIVVSFSENSFSLSKVDSLLKAELDRKKIDISYGLRRQSNWEGKQELREEIINNSTLSAKVSSPFLMNNASLEMFYDNITKTVLQRNAISLLLSFLLAGSIIFSLLYLLKIIQKQKQVSEIKNDLISNITHEFKTPLATISVALESMQRFNTENDSEKNMKYAQLSALQVEKLNSMVEKLLETATLDSNNLNLNFEEINLVDLVEKASMISEDLANGKTISFSSNVETCILKVDAFHFENALNNIVDNAIKYGGNTIEVSLKQTPSEIKIEIKDNGSSLTKQQAAQLFNKFYRVPKGNTHDVKGFGIGLYYTKKIIEKHGGTVSVNLNKETTFIISLPNE